MRAPGAYAAAILLAEPLGSFFGRFLLPGGRPRRLIIDIQAGGRPRRRPLPLAKRSKVMMASSICSRSVRSSASILLMSMDVIPQINCFLKMVSRSEKRTRR